MTKYTIVARYTMEIEDENREDALRRAEGHLMWDGTGEEDIEILDEIETSDG